MVSFPALAALQQHWQRISRVVVAAMVPAAILFCGHAYSPPDSFMHSSAFTSFMQWVVVTSLVVALPTVGKTTQKAVERALGSFLGGVLGLMFAAPEVAWVKLVGMIIAAALGDFVAVHYKKEYTGRLLAMTYLIVVSPGGQATDHPWVAGVVRMASVLAGIAWTFVLSLVWFPDTSSRIAFKQLLVMMQHLQALGTDTWALMEQQHQLLLQQQQQQEQQSQQTNGKQHADDALSQAAQFLAPPLGVQAVELCSAPADQACAVCIQVDDSSNKPQLQPQPPPPQQLPPLDQLDSQANLKQHLVLLEQFLDDPCDGDVREFFAARVLLQDALAAAKSEHHFAWLCGMPIIAPSVLVPCRKSGSTSGCCYRRPSRTKSKHSNSNGNRSSTTTPPTTTFSISLDTSSNKDSSRSRNRSRSEKEDSSNAAAPSSADDAHDQQDDHVCGLPAYLPHEQVRLVAIAQRHCSHVLWMLHKLLQDRFDQRALLAVHRKYPPDMLVNIQRDSQAVLAAATDCLQSAIQQHHHYHRSRDQDSGRVALLQQHLEKLRASMASLHSHLKHWREIFVEISQLRREVVLQVMMHQQSQQVQEAGQGPDTPAHPLAQAAAAAADIDARLMGQPGMQPSTSNGHIALHKFQDLFFITPTSRDSYVFVLQWHALHYTLQQLDQSFTELTGTLQQLLYAMHGVVV